MYFYANLCSYAGPALFIPLSSYILISDSHKAIFISAAVTLLALFFFGIAKGYFTGTSLLKSGLQTVFVGEWLQAQLICWRKQYLKAIPLIILETAIISK